MMFNKAFIRCLICLVILGYGFLFIVAIGNYSAEIERLQDDHLFFRAVLGLIGALGAVSTFLVWFLMLFHWGTNVFKSGGYKLFWFLSMFLGMFVGSLFYYIFVFELKKSLKQNKAEEILGTP